MSEGGHAGKRFRLMLANPSFVVWNGSGSNTLSAANMKRSWLLRRGLPRITNGSLIFLLHMLAKRHEGADGSCIANAPLLFTGEVDCGEREI